MQARLIGQHVKHLDETKAYRNSKMWAFFANTKQEVIKLDI